MEKERYYNYNLENLEPLEYYWLIKRRDPRIISFLARKAGFALGLGIITAGVGLQKKLPGVVKS